jgi:hypothetical protein
MTQINATGSSDNSMQNTSNCICMELVTQFWSLEGDAGLQRKLFSDFAENNLDAFSCFAEILDQSTAKVLRALAMQGLGQIPVSNRPNYQGEDLKNFFKVIFAELQSSSDLLKWSASKVVSDIIPPFILESRQLWDGVEPLDRIELSRSIRQMQSNYINKISYFDIYKRGKRGDEPDYEKYLEYWVYCDTSKLFLEDSNSDNYRIIVEHVLAKLQGYGVILALGCQGQYTTNETVQDAALRQARILYRTEDNQKILYDHLAWYIENPAHSDTFRIHAAETFNLTETWKPEIEKFKTLSNLLFGGQVLRVAGIEILLPQQESLKQNLNDAATLSSIFICLRDFKFDDSTNLEKVSLAEINQLVKVAKNNLSLIEESVAIGKQAATDLSKQLSCEDTNAKQYIQGLQYQHTSQIQDWLRRLNNASQELQRQQRVIVTNQAALDKTYKEVKNANTTTYNAITSIQDEKARYSKDYQTLEKSRQLISRLQTLRKNVENKLDDNSDLTNLIKRIQVAAILAVSIIILTVLSRPVKLWLLDHPVSPPGSSK